MKMFIDGNCMKLQFKWFVVFLMLFVAYPYAVADVNKEQWDKKLHYLGELIEKSSVSKQVLNSGNDAAMQKYKLAQALHEQAVAACHAGRLDETDLLIGKAKKAMIAAAKLSGSHENRQNKERNSYESLKRSINALLDAMQRIGVEKGKKQQTEQIAEKTRESIRQADQYFSAGQYRDGTGLLANAMHGIDTAIREMRSGDTLVRSLSFATPKDEYQYELDRNDTHLMLINVYLKNSANDEMRKKVEIYLDGAREFRAKAEGFASKDKFQDAVREMESSTVNIIRAIRNLGVYIPG